MLDRSATQVASARTRYLPAVVGSPLKVKVFVPPAGMSWAAGVVSFIHGVVAGFGSHFGGFKGAVGQPIVHMFTVTASAFREPRFWTSTVAVEPPTLIPLALACHGAGSVAQSRGTGM